MSEMLIVTNTIHILMVLDPNVATEPDSTDDFGGIVTGPLGLWMFERPGELRLNHSWLKFRTIY